jgi:uncharacterized Zn finger protein
MAFYRDGYGDFPAYVSVAERRAKAALSIQKLEKKGRKLDPVKVEGRAVAESFWGKAWCEHLESYSDYENRLPRGRSYLRNQAVIDLRIAEGRVDALVSGSSIYEVSIRIEKLAKKKWTGLVAKCTGRIDSVVELLRGSVPEAVLSALADPASGLFPIPKEIELSCSCPDYATLCKHVAAVLYGIGARFDRQPELFFTLRSVRLAELVAKSAAGPLAAPAGAPPELGNQSLEGIFGIELDQGAPPPAQLKPAAARSKKSATRGKKRARGTTLPAEAPARARRRRAAGA